MDDKLVTSFVAVVTAIIGVAIIAVIVSSKSNTSGVLSAGGSAFGQILSCAVSPISGGSCGSFTSSSISFGNPL